MTDEAASHRHFSAACFNSAWDLIDKPDRSSGDEVAMLLRSAASAWHWTQRADATPQYLSVGYWQLSRVLALMGESSLAVRFGQLCLEQSRGEPAFFQAYAYEALARAAAVAGDGDAATTHLAEARRLADNIDDDANRAAVLQDLATIPLSR